MFWMVVAAFSLRAEFIAVDHSYLIGPEAGHFGFGYETGSIARALANGEGFSSPFRGHTGSTAWIGPIYVGLVALVFKLFGTFTEASAIVLLGVNALCSAVNAAAIYRLGQRTLGEVQGRIAGWTWALVPVYMQWACTRIWETSASALLLTWGVLLALGLAERETPRRWIGFGAFWAFSSLLNPALTTTGPALGLWLLARRGWRNAVGKRAWQWWRPAVLSMVAFLLVIAPWMARNYAVFHHVVFIRGNFGFEFRLGNFPNSNGMGWSGLHPVLNKWQFEKYERLGEYEFVRQSSREAWSWVRNHPGDFALLSAKRAVHFWDGTTLLYAEHWVEDWNPKAYLISSLLAFGGLLAAWLRRTPGVGAIAMVILIYPIPYYIAYPHERYRHAIEPLLVLLAAHLVWGSLSQLNDIIRRER